ncbi:MAG: hypothetical protein HY904_24290 [Deltaproteobacteria bacterium]|nr:hypothetical protein [Deltaproteobacteria bacterium]
MGWVISLTGVGLFAWLWSDVRAMMRWNTDLSVLAAAGRFDLLAEHCEAGLRQRRPFWRLVQHLLIPGATEASCSLHFYNMGLHDRAWALSQRALELSAHKPAILAAARATAVLALSGLHRFDEARTMFDALRAMPAAPAALLASGTTAALAEGRIADGLATAREVLARDPADEASHLAASAALAELGRFDEALTELEHTPRAGLPQLAERDRARLQADEQGQELLAAQEAERGQVVQPAPHIQAAMVHLERGDVRAAEFHLSRAAAVLGHHPAVGMHFFATRARCAAQRGDVAPMEKDLAAAADMAGRITASRSLRVELLLARGRALAEAGRPADALAALEDALSGNPAPYTAKVAALHRGNALLALGRREEARAAWQQAAEAEAGTHTRRLAEAALAAAS